MSAGSGPMPRRAALADRELLGRDWCRALSDATDAWVREVFEAAVADLRPRARLALIATGGYGRGELAPSSDLDLLLLHDVRAARVAKLVEPVAAAVWYPMWDEGVKLGHAVRRIDEHLALVEHDLDTATASLDARLVAGDEELAADLLERVRSEWARRPERRLEQLAERAEQRRTANQEVAYLLEPDLKDGHGGLRDVHSLWWGRAAELRYSDDDAEALDDCYGTLVRARVGLHLAIGRPVDALRLEDQDAAAATAGWPDADAMMADVAAAARTVMWLGDEAWGRAFVSHTGEARSIAPHIRLIDGEIALDADVDIGADPSIILQTAVAAARRGCRIRRSTLNRLADELEPWEGSWPVGATGDLVALLLEGHAAIPVLEAMDQRGLISRMLPEWAPNRSRPQRNAYHRFTVDRHLWEAAANAAELVDRVSRPDLLVLGALFHDIGKGYPGDHTEVGMELVARIAPRLGFSERDVAALVAMVEHHLLLPDVAMRRDLTDEATISAVADAVGTVEVLELLDALTEADSKATGPSAWGTWKRDLVAELVTRVRHVLGGGDVGEVTWRLFPDAVTLEVMAQGVDAVWIHDERVTAVNADRPGTFANLAGVLSLHGLDVVSAQAHSDEPQAGRATVAASQFRVVLPPNGLDDEALVADLHRAMNGELAIAARLHDRARTYRRQRPTQAQRPEPPSVTFHDGASSNATVIEVRAPTSIGVLHRITKALADVGLDIRHALVQTIGMEVVDTFYVRTWRGELVTDPFHRAEVERAVLHAAQ